MLERLTTWTYRGWTVTVTATARYPCDHDPPTAYFGTDGEVALESRSKVGLENLIDGAIYKWVEIAEKEKGH